MFSCDIMFLCDLVCGDLTPTLLGDCDEVNGDGGNDDSEVDEDLQGASRVVGGIFRGRAVGNAPAFVDLHPETVNAVPQVKGRVILHVDDKSMPYSMPQPVGSDLPSVLDGLVKVYSPIKRQNARMSVMEDGAWTLKGRFLNALRMREHLPWMQDDEGKWSVTLRAEGALSEPASPGGTDSLLPSATVSSEATATGTALQAQLISMLNIPETLTARGRGNDLRLAYAKYRGVLNARSNMQRMKADGTWALGTVSVDTLIELFVSKTVWYTYYKKLFPRVIMHPELVKWMENDPGAKSSYDIWGTEKASYSFQDLKVLLDWLDARSTQKKKEKRKVRDGENRDSSSKKQKWAKSNDDGNISM